jgi:alkanesulfonate monooxygenase SsuD/methylene tetrahydromethanopterin reductase-like flavin-dependent oxidoreductase (luciferase family)
MKIGIGLPANIPDVPGERLLEWARLAESGPFSSLSVIDRLVYPNYEPLVTLAACAGVTQRVRLITSVLLAPLRNAALLAKQAASLDALSNGRLTLGLGIGGREDDFRAVSVSFKDRGKHFEEQLTLMRRIWSGQPLGDGVGAIGPKPVRPGGPEVLIGGYSPAAMRRVGRWGDGYIAGGGSVEQAAELYRAAEASWKAEGRAGKPRFVGAFYFGLGPNALERASVSIRDYYAFLGSGVEGMIRALPATPEAVQQAIQARLDIGMDEVIAWPCIPDLDQVKLLADVVNRMAGMQAAPA